MKKINITTYNRRGMSFKDSRWCLKILLQHLNTTHRDQNIIIHIEDTHTPCSILESNTYNNDSRGLLFITSRSNQHPWNHEYLFHIQLSVVRVDSVKSTLSIHLVKDARTNYPCIQVVVDCSTIRSTDRLSSTDGRLSEC